MEGGKLLVESWLEVWLASCKVVGNVGAPALGVPALGVRIQSGFYLFLFFSCLAAYRLGGPFKRR